MAAASQERSLERRLEELAAINESIHALTSTLELPEILRLLLERIERFTSTEALSLWLYDRARDELVFAATESLRENRLVGTDAPAECTGDSAVREDGKLLVAPLRRGERTLGGLELRLRPD